MKKYRSFAISALVFIAVLALGTLYQWQVDNLHRIQNRHSILEIAASHAYSIERQLSRSLSAVYALAANIRLYGEIPNFREMADQIILNYGGISSLQLAPQGIVRQIYPLKGNEKAIGHNLLKDPARRTEALKTIESRELTLAGPFELIQGGQAVIGRLPVFDNDDNTGSEVFWGFAIVLIRLPKLLAATQIQSLTDKGHQYELSRKDPDSGNRLVFSRSGKEPLISPVSFSFSVPNGEWTLSISTDHDWQHGPEGFYFFTLVIVVGLSFSWLTFALLHRSEQIRSKSRELESSNKKLQATLADVKQLSGLLPICAYCKKIRDDKGYWNQIEAYIKDHSEAQFSHGICRDCAKEHFPDLNVYED
jgi:sensor domain CHASE-containing protein